MSLKLAAFRSDPISTVCNGRILPRLADLLLVRIDRRPWGPFIPHMGLAGIQPRIFDKALDHF